MGIAGQVAMVQLALRRSFRAAFGRACRNFCSGSAPTVVLGATGSSGDLKRVIAQQLKARGVTVKDVGEGTFYDVAADVAREVQRGEGVQGLLFSPSGAGPAVVANKFKGVYAVAAESPAAARLARSLHGANVLSLSQLGGAGDAADIVEAFLSQEFGKAPAAPPPEWWTDAVVDEARSSLEQVKRMEMRAIDEGVQEFLHSANAAEDRARGFATPGSSPPSSPGVASGAQAPPTPPPPPGRYGAKVSPPSASAYPPTPPPPPGRR